MCDMAETKARDAEVDEREDEDAEVEERAAVTPNPGTAVTPLTVPCTLQQLRQWLKGVDGLIQANTKSVTASATAISVA
jgi:hypothetical protein